MPGPYRATLARLDLTSGSAERRDMPGGAVENWVGGKGFAAKILYEELKPGVDPLSPGSKVVFAPGPLTGVLLPGSGKMQVAAKSPATGIYGDSNIGGHFGPALRYAGIDVLVIEGALSRPGVVVIDDDRVDVVDGSGYWGKGAIETETLLKKQFGREYQVITIGPAGENRVKFACLSHDFGRQAGRCGMGAILGAKGLKAVVVRGTGAAPAVQLQAAYELGREMLRDMQSRPAFATFPMYGTAATVDWANEAGVFPTKNFQSGFFPDYRKINGESLRKSILLHDKACFGCPIPCGKYSSGNWHGSKFYVEGPEYETTGMFGGGCLLSDINEIAYVNYLCDELGLDTISAGAVCAFAFEAHERGVLSKSAAGRTLRFGSAECIAYLLEQIAYRRGIGDLLADGTRAAADALGRGSKAYAVQIKGLELSAYETHYAPSMMLAYMTCDIGAHHTRAWTVAHDLAVGRDVIEGKAEKVVQEQSIRPIFDILGVCRFPWLEIGIPTEPYARLLSLVTGIDFSWDDLVTVSERIWNLTRVFAFREIPDFGRSYDLPPARFTTDPAVGGPSDGKLLAQEDVERMLDEYYFIRGWDSNGRPKPETLGRLGLALGAEEPREMLR